jgi:hypothetical protein
MFAIASAVAVSGVATRTAVAVPKKPAVGAKAAPACGVKVLPLVVGNTWTYAPVPSPDPIAQELTKLAPPQPRQIVVSVKSIETKGGDTVATLEEKLTYETVARTDKKPAVVSEVVVNSTISCNAKKFEISPDSFFFAAEPGGFRELVFDKLERSKDTSWKLTGGTVGDAPWREDIIAHFTRQPVKGSAAKLSAGKLELERAFTPEKSETVVTRSGETYDKAEKLALITTGRVTLDAPTSPTPAPSELPKNWLSKLWFANGVGVVQTQNMYAHRYQLTAVQLN